MWQPEIPILKVTYNEQTESRHRDSIYYLSGQRHYLRKWNLLEPTYQLILKTLHQTSRFDTLNVGTYRIG